MIETGPERSQMAGFEDWEMALWVKECEQSPEALRGKKLDPFLDPSDRNAALPCIERTFAQWDSCWASDLNY